MATRPNNLTINDSQSWRDLWNITAGIDDMQVEIVGANNVNYARGVYTGSGAITLSNYNNFPIGSQILDIQAKKWHIKTAATTWLSSAAMS